MNDGEPPALEFYDLINDPAETSGNSKTHLDRIRALADELTEYRDLSASYMATYGSESEETIEMDEKALRDLEALGYVR